MKIKLNDEYENFLLQMGDGKKSIFLVVFMPIAHNFVLFIILLIFLGVFFYVYILFSMNLSVKGAFIKLLGISDLFVVSIGIVLLVQALIEVLKFFIILKSNRCNLNSFLAMDSDTRVVVIEYCKKDE